MLADRVVRLSVLLTYSKFPGKLHSACKQHSQPYCTATAGHGQKPCWIYICCVSLISWLLSVINYLHPDIFNVNHMAEQSAWVEIYAFSHAGVQKQTPYLNMTCEIAVYFLPWFSACVCAEWCQPLVRGWPVKVTASISKRRNLSW